MPTQDIEDRLWQEFWAARNNGDREEAKECRGKLVVYYAGGDRYLEDYEDEYGKDSYPFHNRRPISLVEGIALNLIRRCGLDRNLLPDLITDGLLASKNITNNGYRQEGLFYAIDHYDPTKGILFIVYARYYVKWAMLHGDTFKNSVDSKIIDLRKNDSNSEEKDEDPFNLIPDSKASVEGTIVDQEELEIISIMKTYNEFLKLSEEKRNELNVLVHPLIKSIGLSDREWRVVLGFNLDNKKHKILASELSIGEGNSRQIYIRAINKIRKFFPEYNQESMKW